MTDLHFQVEQIGKGFKVIGMPTPATVPLKSRLFSPPNRDGERVALVAIDVFRCSSTIAALIAAGAEVVLIAEKNGHTGPTLNDCNAVADSLGVELVLAGELHGRPIAGGVVGNSPREVTPSAFRGRAVRFSTTNLGRLFDELTKMTDAFLDEGGGPTILVACAANANATSRWMTEQEFDRIALCCGGFYGASSIEDDAVAGDIIRFMGLPLELLDDDARKMAAVSAAYPTCESRIAAFSTNFIGRALKLFGVEADVEATLSGRGVAQDVWHVMQRQVLIVERIDGVPVIRAARRRALDIEAVRFSNNANDDYLIQAQL